MGQLPAMHQRQHHLRRGATHTFGLLLAGAVLLIFAVIVMIFVVRAPPRAAGEALPASTGPAPDIKQLPSDPTGINSLQNSGRFFARIVSKDDPTRLDGEISGERYIPLEQQRFKLEKPEGWAFLKSGRTVHIQSDTGRTYMPDQGNGARPRDAVLEGNVVIKIFDPKPGGKRPDLATDRPFGIVTTSLLKFDGELGKIELPERFEVTSDAVDYTGTGLTALLNNVDNRLELLHVAQTELVLIKPGYKAPPAPSPAPMTVAAAPAGPAAATAPGSTPKASPSKPVRKDDQPPAETLYHMVCTDKVVVVQAGRKIESEKLDAWVRTEGNTLRPGAIATSNSQSRQQGPSEKPAAGPAPKPSVPAIGAPTTTDSNTPAAPAERPVDGTLFNLDSSDGPVTLTWSGPMEVRPLSSAPGELTYNDVFVRFTSEKDGDVRFTDEKSKAQAAGSLIDYGATRREVALASHEPMAAAITQPGSGTAQGQRWEMSLATGMAHASSRGTITAEKGGALPSVGVGETKDEDPQEAAGPLLQRSLSWNDQADFRFVMNEKHEVTPVIAEVHANGNARATDGKSELSGESLVAQFKPVSPKASRIDRLQLAGHAAGGDGRGGTLNGDTLDLAFVPTPDKPEQSDPSVVTAQGSVQAKRKDDTLSASYLQAQIVRQTDQKLDVSHVTARDADFVNADGTHAKAEKLEADPIAKTVHLTSASTNAEVSRQGTTVTGADMILSQTDRKLDVNGGGTLTHDGPLGGNQAAGGDQRPAHAEAKWAREMVFEDATGKATCLGDVQAVVTKPPHTGNEGKSVGLELDTINADEVHLTFTPAPPERDKTTPTDKPAEKVERRLLTVESVGTLATSPDGKPAKIESRRYAVETPAQGQEPTLERSMYLNSARINVNNEKGTLDTPAPGEMLIVDRRAAAAKAKEQPKPGGPLPLDAEGGPRGSTHFKWKGTMSMDRPSGTVHLNDHVTMEHQDMGEVAATLLDCENLTANVRELTPPDASKSPDSFTGELTSADAQGAVWLRSRTHELMADSLHYDALKKFVTAKASEGNMVTVFEAGPDAKMREPVNAREIEWDLATDRIVAKGLGPAVAPVAPHR
jgi:lipopolysaccharide export system protein LptA